MADITQFIMDSEYRRLVLKFIDLKINNTIKKHEEDISYDTSNIRIDLKKLKKFKPNEIDSEDEYEDKWGDDFEVDQIHRYEDNMVIILKYLLDDNSKIQNKKITHIIFRDNIYNFNSSIKKNNFEKEQIYSKKWVYSEGWIYSISILMLIDDKLLDYHYLSQSIGTHYKKYQHILAYDGKLLFDLVEKEFYKLYPESESDDNSKSDENSESDKS